MDVSLAILGTGLLVFLAHLFAAAFDRASIPDVLPLMTIGLILGPLLGWISKDSFGEIGPIFSTIALVVILFHSGLELKLSDLKNSIFDATGLTVVSFVFTILVVMLVGTVWLGLPLIGSTLLGFIIGGTSAAVIIPLVGKLDILKETKTKLVLESSLSDVL
ncbi:MAG TPA: cation:proton antiporter, partial [Candidatus Melainabacteria bacterium]|nr:cation:proton antiporter [Candidatus Melainabacteria bacterium]